MYFLYIIQGKSDFFIVNNLKVIGYLIKIEKIIGNKGKVEICVEF